MGLSPGRIAIPWSLRGSHLSLQERTLTYREGRSPLHFIISHQLSTSPLSSFLMVPRPGSSHWLRSLELHHTSLPKTLLWPWNSPALGPTVLPIASNTEFKFSAQVKKDLYGLLLL